MDVPVKCNCLSFTPSTWTCHIPYMFVYVSSKANCWLAGRNDESPSLPSLAHPSQSPTINTTLWLLHKAQCHQRHLSYTISRSGKCWVGWRQSSLTQECHQPLRQYTRSGIEHYRYHVKKCFVWSAAE